MGIQGLVLVYTTTLIFLGEVSGSSLPTSILPFVSQPNATLGNSGKVALNCSHVQHLVAKMNSQSSYSTSDKSTQGIEFPICDAGRTCCTQEIERSFVTFSSEDFRSVIQASGSLLTGLLTTTSSRLEETVLKMVKWAENNTKALFAQIYHHIEPEVQLAWTKFYSNLTDFLRGKNIDIEAQVAKFFISLFPYAYRHGINSNLEVSEKFVTCLRQVQSNVKPFGEIPKYLAFQLSRSFQDARTLLQALNLGLEVINNTNHKEFGMECTKALVKLTYCAHCQRLKSSKPCSGYCINVARGCLAHVAELDHPWSDFVTGLELLISGMVDDRNIEKVLSTMDTKITESLMYAMEHGPQLTAQVQTHCGHYRRSEKPMHSSLAVSKETNIFSQATSIKFEPKLNQRLQVFLHKLADFKGYYGNLADSVCNDHSWASQDGIHCWNGYKLGEYKKTIAGIGVGAQKYNPEISLKGSHDSMTVNLVNKLMRMRELLDRQITRIPKSESLIVWNEAGSGERRRIWEESSVHDDEDYYYYGSGNGRLFGTFFKNYEHFISSGSGDNDPLYSGPSPVPTTGDAGSETSRTNSDIQFDNEENIPSHGDPKDKEGNAANRLTINAALFLHLVISTVVVHHLGQSL